MDTANCVRKKQQKEVPLYEVNTGSGTIKCLGQIKNIPRRPKEMGGVFGGS